MDASSWSTSACEVSTASVFSLRVCGCLHIVRRSRGHPAVVFTIHAALQPQGLKFLWAACSPGMQAALRAAASELAEGLSTWAVVWACLTGCPDLACPPGLHCSKPTRCPTASVRASGGRQWHSEGYELSSVFLAVVLAFFAVILVGLSWTPADPWN